MVLDPEPIEVAVLRPIWLVVVYAPKLDLVTPSMVDLSTFLATHRAIGFAPLHGSSTSIVSPTSFSSIRFSRQGRSLGKNVSQLPPCFPTMSCSAGAQLQVLLVLATTSWPSCRSPLPSLDRTQRKCLGTDRRAPVCNPARCMSTQQALSL